MLKIQVKSKVIILFEWFCVTTAYFVLRLPSLLLLPVFADEAIYIRWSQLIRDDWQRYLFFSMADGKPPLFMWLLSGFSRFFADPLFAGRFLSVLFGFLTLIAMRALVAEFSKSWISRLVATAAVIFMPFWFFYQRITLMDGMLAFFLCLTLLFSVRLCKSLTQGQIWRNIFYLGLSFAAAMYTKTPAMFMIPPIALLPVLFWYRSPHKNYRNLATTVSRVALGGVIGTLIFSLLMVSPFFRAIFARGGDFTFSLHEILAGAWVYILEHNLTATLGWISLNVTPEWFFLASIGLLNRKLRPIIFYAFGSVILFYLPLSLFGKVLFPRYFLPTVIFLTLAMSLSVMHGLTQRYLRPIVLIVFLFGLWRSSLFMYYAFSNLSLLPLVREDRQQYLEEWSAGFGNSQVRDFIYAQNAQLPALTDKKIILLTEGSFGTLPDGIFMYFYHNPNASHVEVHGIGVAPAVIPLEFLVRTSRDDVYYVLNSHRMGLANQTILKKIFTVERPDGQSLTLYKIDL